MVRRAGRPTAPTRRDFRDGVAAVAAGRPAPSESQVDEPAVAGDAAQTGDVPAVPPRGAEPHRRRRRRRGPRRDAGSAEATAGREAEAAESASRPSLDQPDGDSGAPPGAGEIVQNGASPPRAAGAGEQRGGQPHRRRRRPPRAAEASAAGAAEAAGSSPAEAASAPASRNPPAPYGGSRSWGPRNRRTREAGLPEKEPRDAGSGERARGSARHDTGGSGPDGRGRDFRDRRAHGRGAPGPADRRQGRGRDTPKQRPEQRLYALELVVDRGFEDVADETDDSVTRRVHWTIIKRAVADQNSGKPISVGYVLQRDGVDTEFPNLGAARAAANKTIVHPEKLTLSKAEHAAAKK